MTKKEVKAMSDEFDTFGVQVTAMVKFVEKHKEWAEKKSENDDDSDDYSLACRIVCFEDGLNEMEKQM